MDALTLEDLSILRECDCAPGATFVRADDMHRAARLTEAGYLERLPHCICTYVVTERGDDEIVAAGGAS
jgi:hypothetical protein